MLLIFFAIIVVVVLRITEVALLDAGEWEDGLESSVWIASPGLTGVELLGAGHH